MFTVISHCQGCVDCYLKVTRQEGHAEALAHISPDEASISAAYNPSKLHSNNSLVIENSDEAHEHISRGY